MVRLIYAQNCRSVNSQHAARLGLGSPRSSAVRSSPRIRCAEANRIYCGTVLRGSTRFYSLSVLQNKSAFGWGEFYILAREGVRMNTNGGGRQVQATKTSLEVMETLRELDGARVTELAEALDLSPSTVHAHLSTLVSADYVVKSGDIYHLSLQFLGLADYV